MGVVPVDRHYYLDAMAAFRDHFAKTAHVAFVFVSDDMQVAWCSGVQFSKPYFVCLIGCIVL